MELKNIRLDCSFTLRMRMRASLTGKRCELITIRLGLLGIAIAMTCTVRGEAASTTTLKPLEPAAIKATVHALAKELMVPGAMVLTRTPQGEFVFGSGTTPNKNVG
jgi:hypothetical protein